MTRPITEWTTETPKAGGWYWAWYILAPGHPDPGDRMRLEIVNLTFDLNGKYPVITRASSDWPHHLDEFTHWLGPLPEPGLPVDEVP